MKKIFFILLFLVFTSCSNVEFLYNTNEGITNPIYGKTKVYTSGVDLVFMKSYIPKFFGDGKEKKFNLSISVEEKKIKRSVEKNQTTSNLNYELRFTYVLESITENCVIYNKEILSSFSIIPKSSGYDYGTEASLEKKYQVAVSENFNQFVSFLSGLTLNNCVWS